VARLPEKVSKEVGGTHLIKWLNNKLNQL